MPLLLPVILCGGGGTRMWPESRESLPKQFIPLIGERSSFQNTAAMFADRSTFAPPLVVSNREYGTQVAEQLAQIGAEAEIVLEPMRRDSGPAVAVAAEIAARRDPEAVVIVMASDHHVLDRPGLVALYETAARAAARGFIVTLGMKPSYLATGYGYLRPGRAIVGDVRALEAFVEKPDLATAARYIDEGYLWNSGNFVFPAALMQAEVARFEPQMAHAAAEAVRGARADGKFTVLEAEAFARAPKKSIDYAVMERTRQAAVIAADIGWSDIGTWSAVRDVSERDGDGNAVRGDGVILHSANALVRSQGPLTAVIGVDDVIVITTPDAVLVLGAQHADKVKDLVERLRAEGRAEVLAHTIAVGD